MPVNTKQVATRRPLRYQTLADLLSDAEHLANTEVEMVGNWSLAQVFDHLTKTMNASIDGFPFQGSLPMRVFLRLFMKKRFLTRSLPAGFQIPEQASPLAPTATSTDESMSALRLVIGRLRQESKRALHPFLGVLSRDEWTEFHLRHAELHMSFAVPDNGAK